MPNTHHTLLTFNNPDLTARVRGVFVKALGADNVVDVEPAMVSEDFSLYSLEGHKIPAVIFWLGAVDPAKIASGVELPSLHSSLFAPVAEPALRTGITAMSDAALELLQ